ncbi:MULTISPECIES: molybdopterin synthase catalytic subunit [unclassified Campylobacter]|uniref:molybdopterin synthase catalytic subunit n=1 Tax=unclassified Campylobacter TaxID=2593542 RepID=UPI0022E9B584|nr:MULTISPECIES: molybdenum cofactor biosynthesis protein MoaE [unclassified Campylobacter]MDA3062651.1 molybdenum cofactor biosynthesis protein MoaE [Campylobacter sp. JMF_14 EL1]MDA3073907.1 molybdenum cofactor biosynthesis protein MoaE [Campylobacter sp. JMF_10 EL2]
MKFVGNFSLHDGALDIPAISNSWYERYKGANCGALITFVGIVRDEDGISGLSFDIYEPILRSWFQSWQTKAQQSGTQVFFAHSKGDVSVHESSYIAGVLSPQRKVALALINDFVEDFKANAPIWKYDLIKSERIYAASRSQKLRGAGILG